MLTSKADILSRLQKEILSLQGYRPIQNNMSVDIGLQSVLASFPNNTFPVGAVHEFIANGAESSAASCGFISGLLSGMIQREGVTVWISTARTLFPPALAPFGISPEKVIFVDVKNEKNALWAAEEALKCSGLVAVVAEIKNVSFTASRRLQLAVENSQVTGWVIRNNPLAVNTTACFSRWNITSLPGEIMGELPGVGFPCWKVDLLKVRNGKPGSWEISWQNGQFHVMNKQVVPQIQWQKKTG